MAMYKSAVATWRRPVNNTCVNARLKQRSNALVFFGGASLLVTKLTRLSRYAYISESINSTLVPNFSRHFLKGLYRIKASSTCSVNTYSCLYSRAKPTAFSSICSISGLVCMDSFYYVLSECLLYYVLLQNASSIGIY